MDWQAFWDRKAGESGVDGIGRSSSSIADTFELLAHIARTLDLRTSDSLLDVGCGNGELGIHLKYIVQRYLGLDVSMEQLDVLDRRCPSCEWLNEDARELVESVGVGWGKALYASTLQYLDDMAGVEQAIREAHRVLKPGGRVLFSMNPDIHMREWYMEGIPEDRAESREAATAAVWFDPQGLRELVERCGFANAHIAVLPHSLFQAAYMFDVVAEKAQ